MEVTLPADQAAVAEAVDSSNGQQHNAVLQQYTLNRQVFPRSLLGTSWCRCKQGEAEVNVM
jgi:hypothetical protein